MSKPDYSPNGTVDENYQDVKRLLFEAWQTINSIYGHAQFCNECHSFEIAKDFRDHRGQQIEHLLEDQKSKS